MKPSLKETLFGLIRAMFVGFSEAMTL